MSESAKRDWVGEYAQSHQHPVNRMCHSFGIPLIVVSLLMFAAGVVVDGLWKAAVALFVVGWVFQFVGHAFERKPPEFFKDPRFLFVGVRWWVAKMRGKV